MKRTRQQIETAYRLSIGKWATDLWATKQPALTASEKQEVQRLWEVEKEHRQIASNLNVLYRLNKNPKPFRPLPPLHACLLSADLWEEVPA